MTIVVRTVCLDMLPNFVDDKRRIRDIIRVPLWVCLGFGCHTRLRGVLRGRWIFSPNRIVSE